MLTIGYGDFVPYTFGGRLISMVAGLWGTFICSLVVVCLYGLFDLSNDQFLVFVRIVKGRSAIKFIENAYLLRRKRVLEKRKKNETKDDYDEMIESFNEFKNMRNESKSIYRSNGLLFYNMKLLKEMKKVLHKFDKLEYDIEGLGGYGNKTYHEEQNFLNRNNNDKSKLTINDNCDIKTINKENHDVDMTKNNKKNYNWNNSSGHIYKLDSQINDN